MDWSKGYSSRFIVCLVDKDTWSDIEEHEFISASINIDNSKDLIASASLSMSDKLVDGENYIRIYLIARQDGESARVPLFTGLSSTPERKIDGSRYEHKIDAYSVLKPASDVIVKRGYYVPAASGAEKIKDILSVCDAPIIIEGTSPVTSSNIIADDGDTRLEIALKVLDAINWRIKLTGDGTIIICEKSSDPVDTFGVSKNDIIETTVTEKYDWYNTPNVFMAVSDDYGASIAMDESDGQYSISNRGREIWMYEDGVELSSDENIAEYASRRLKEEQSPKRTLSYTRRFMANIYTTDVVRLNYPKQDIDGLYRIDSQNIEVSYGCSVKEEVTKIE